MTRINKTFFTNKNIIVKNAVLLAVTITLVCLWPVGGHATQLNNTKAAYSDYYPQQEGVNFQVFYDELAPYGYWYNHPRYGYAWSPRVAYGFNPYVTSGHWVLTDYGWTWVSDYNWGWAPFHYGRWVYDDYAGWLWTPGYQWSPAWVTWGNYGGYYGWAPLPWGVRDEDYYRGYRPEYRYWTFCERGHFNDEHLEWYGIRNNNVAYSYYNNVTVLNNYSTGERGRRYASGPRREEVEQYTHTRISTARIENSNHPGRDAAANGRISMYRPAIASSTQSKAAPARVEPINNLRTNNAHTIPGNNQNATRTNIPVNRPAERNPGTTPQTHITPSPPSSPSIPDNHITPQGARANTAPGNNRPEPVQNRAAPSNPSYNRSAPQQQPRTNNIPEARPSNPQPNNPPRNMGSERPQGNPTAQPNTPRQESRPQAAPQRAPQQPSHQQAAPTRQEPPREQARPEGGERPR